MNQYYLQRRLAANLFYEHLHRNHRYRIRVVVVPLRGRFQPRSRDAAQLEQPNERFLDQVIGTGRTGSDADNNGTGRQPEVRKIGRAHV